MEKCEPKIKPTVIVKVENSLARGVDEGILSTQEFGEFMLDFVCPHCAIEVCPLGDTYKEMMEGATQKELIHRMEKLAKTYGITLDKQPTPNFLKIPKKSNESQ